MRRSSIVVTALITVFALAALAAPAMASDHRVRITEVQTGANQFVELQDSADEPFPNQPYRLVFYDHLGNETGQENLLKSGLDASGTSTYTVGRDPNSVDEFLSQNTRIDPTRGQICFTRGPNQEKIHCVAYGCVTNPVGNLAPDGGGLDPAPRPDGGQSSQRQGSGRYNLGNPTPDAPNVAGRRAFTCEITGNRFANSIVGTPFDDLIVAGRGNDRIRTLGGNDRIRCGSGRDRVSGGADNDRIFGASGRDRLAGNSGRDRIRGESGNDRLFGGSGNDRLGGGSGRDRISGGFGTDIMSGGPGRDFLSGGPGIDITTR